MLTIFHSTTVTLSMPSRLQLSQLHQELSRLSPTITTCKFRGGHLCRCHLLLTVGHHNHQPSPHRELRLHSIKLTLLKKPKLTLMGFVTNLLLFLVTEKFVIRINQRMLDGLNITEVTRDHWLKNWPRQWWYLYLNFYLYLSYLYLYLFCLYLYLIYLYLYLFICICGKVVIYSQDLNTQS